MSLLQIEGNAIPALTFDMLQTNRRGEVLATRAFQRFFGPEDYKLFKKLGETGEYISEEDRSRVDNRAYAQVAALLSIPEEKGKDKWKQAIALSNSAVNYARVRLFADQERRVTLANRVARVRRPSSALEILTTPVDQTGKQCRYEQGRQLALAIPALEVIKMDESDNAEIILDEIERMLDEQFFVSKPNDVEDYTVYSFHDPYTNRLRGVSRDYPDHNFSEGLWVKKLTYPCRTIGLSDGSGLWLPVKALYDDREKDPEAAVLKALQRSKIAKKKEEDGKDTEDSPIAKKKAEGGKVIEVSPYTGDRIGFRLVTMEGGREMRDIVTAKLDKLLHALGHDVKVTPRDRVNEQNGDPTRIEWNRRDVKSSELAEPFEWLIQALEDYVSYQYEVGDFDPGIGRHNGQAHPFYKLDRVYDVAEDIWPSSIFGLDLKEAKVAASFDSATKLGRNERVYPSPYLGQPGFKQKVLTDALKADIVPSIFRSGV